jgi:hypothetical protein
VRVAFDDLTQTELTLGCFRLLTDRLDVEQERGSGNTVSRAITDFMSEWTNDLVRYEYRIVRGYVKSVFLALEQGRVTWRETAKLAIIRASAMENGEQRVAPTARQSGQQPQTRTNNQTASQGTTSQKKRYCADFNKGTCTITGSSHNSSTGLVQHICAFCFNKKGKVFFHAEVNCMQKSGKFPKDLSKNE